MRTFTTNPRLKSAAVCSWNKLTTQTVQVYSDSPNEQLWYLIMSMHVFDAGNDRYSQYKEAHIWPHALHSSSSVSSSGSDESPRKLVGALIQTSSGAHQRLIGAQCVFLLVQKEIVLVLCVINTVCSGSRHLFIFKKKQYNKCPAVKSIKTVQDWLKAAGF